jgi:2-methylcitrate dehydratase PrpD
MLSDSIRSTLEWLFAASTPLAVEHKARLLVLDTLGCVLAASDKDEPQALARRLAEFDPGVCVVPGFPARFSSGAAAAQFAAAACWDEACEGLARAHGRPGVPVLAAVSAVAQAQGRTLGELLDALVVGYEIGARIGAALRIAPGMHVDGTWPCFGVAAATVRLAGGTAQQAARAISIAACQMPYSLYAPVEAGATGRNTYLAHAAQLGMLAGASALAGVGAPGNAIDTLQRLALAGAPTGAPWARPEEWLMLEGYLKPYAAVRHVHYGAAAAIALRDRLAGRFPAITRLKLHTYPEALTYCGNRNPATALAAQFSLSFGVARALVAGDLAPDAYAPQALADSATRALEAKVELAIDERMASAGTRGGCLEIEVAGQTLSCAIDRVEGDPGSPMSTDAVLAKFCRYAAGALGEPRASRAADALLAAGRERGWSDIVGPLAVARLAGPTED